MDNLSRVFYLTGRALLGLYFIVPGVMKIVGFSATADYMAAHDMRFVPFFLTLTIVIQIAGGVSLVLGYRQQIVAFVLAGLVLVINLVMHDFWTLEEGLQRAHETQNFIKNLAILAGLLVLSGAKQRQ